MSNFPAEIHRMVSWANFHVASPTITNQSATVLPAANTTMLVQHKHNKLTLKKSKRRRCRSAVRADRRSPKRRRAFLRVIVHFGPDSSHVFQFYGNIVIYSEKKKRKYTRTLSMRVYVAQPRDMKTRYLFPIWDRLFGEGRVTPWDVR